MTDSSERDLPVPAEGEYQVNSIETAGSTWSAFGNKWGAFRAWHPQHGEVKANNYDELTEKVRKATATGRVKVSVPYAYAHRSREGWTIEHAEATGIHGGTGNVLTRDSRGSTSQITGYRLHGYFRVPSPEDEREMIELLNARDAATEKYDELAGRYAFPGSLTSAVKDKVDRVKRGLDDA